MALYENLTPITASVLDGFYKYLPQFRFQRDPYGFIRSKMWYNELGKSPKITTQTYERPDAYPTSTTLETISFDNGPGASGGDQATREILTGREVRTAQLLGDGWRSSIINLNDLDFTEQAPAVVSNIMMQFADWTTIRHADFCRIQQLKNLWSKLSLVGSTIMESDTTNESLLGHCVALESVAATAGNATTVTLADVATVSDTNDAYNGNTAYIVNRTTRAIVSKAPITDYVGATRVVTVADWLTPAGDAGGTDPDNTYDVVIMDDTKLPTSDLTWDGLREVYELLQMRGAGTFAFGRSDGEDTFMLTIGGAAKTNLYRDDLISGASAIAVQSLFQRFISVRGIKTAARGFAPNVDIFPLRFNAVGELIYPMKNESLTGDNAAGGKSVPNPDYKPTYNGGKAVYEAAFINTTNNWYVAPRRPSPTDVGGAKFSPQTYVATIKQMNEEKIADGNGGWRENKHGRLAYFEALSQKAAIPQRGDLGATVLFKITDPSQV